MNEEGVYGTNFIEYKINNIRLDFTLEKDCCIIWFDKM